MNLTNSRVLITGGSAGIGRAMAAALAGAGAKVAITGRDERKLAGTAAALGAHPIRADVSDEADVRRTYDEFLRTFGHLDVLVNNAGFGTFDTVPARNPVLVATVYVKGRDRYAVGRRCLCSWLSS